MSYAEAINRALQERLAQLRDYGGFLAQAGIPMTQAGIGMSDGEHDMSFDDWKVIKQGHDRQRFDFPNG